jgi:hypothetical protein
MLPVTCQVTAAGEYRKELTDQYGPRVFIHQGSVDGLQCCCTVYIKLSETAIDQTEMQIVTQFKRVEELRFIPLDGASESGDESHQSLDNFDEVLVRGEENRLLPSVGASSILCWSSTGQDT